MTPDSGILTFILNSFLTVFAGGFAGVDPDARRILFLLASLELTVAGLWWALKGEDVIVGLIQKIMLIGVFAFFVLNWPTFISSVVNGFVNTGLAAGAAGGGGAFPSMTDPSSIIDIGFRVIDPLSNKVATLNWYELGDLAMYGLAMILILLAFFILAIQVTLTYLEFYLVAVLALILVPFGVNRWTAFLSEKAFGSIVGFGVKLMVLAFIMSAATPVMTAITLPVDPTLKQAWCVFLAAAFLAFLAWHAPGVASGMMAGGPSLSAASAARTAVAGALGGLGAARGVASAAVGAGQAGKAATLAAASGAGGAMAAGQMGAATAAMGGAGRLGQAVGAAQGVATAAGGAVKSAAMTPVQAVSESLKNAWRKGEVGAWKGMGFNPAPVASPAPAPAKPGGAPSSAFVDDAKRAMHTLHKIPDDANPTGGMNPNLRQ